MKAGSSALARMAVSSEEQARALESAPSFGCKLKTSGPSSFDVV